MCRVHVCLPKELNSLFSGIQWEFLEGPAGSTGTFDENLTPETEYHNNNDLITTDTMHKV